MSGLAGLDPWPGSRDTPGTAQGSYQPPSVHSQTPQQAPVAPATYSVSAEGAVTDETDWPASPPTPGDGEHFAARQPSDERIRSVARNLMSRVPPGAASRPTARGSGCYLRGPQHWPPTPPTPESRDAVCGRAARPADAADAADAAGYLAQPVDWPPSAKTPATTGSSAVARRRIGSASSSSGTPDGLPGTASSVYFTPPEHCCSNEQFFTPPQSLSEMRLGSGGRRGTPVGVTGSPLAGATGGTPVGTTGGPPSGVPGGAPGGRTSQDEFSCRAERLMSRYEGLQPCLPIESLQQAAADGSEPWSSPRSVTAADPAWIEPAQGGYGFQRYPQGSEQAQMWYGHERASLPSDAGSEIAPVLYATSDSYEQSESEYPPSIDDTSDVGSLDTGWQSEITLPPACMEPDDQESLARGYHVPDIEYDSLSGGSPGVGGGPPDGGPQEGGPPGGVGPPQGGGPPPPLDNDRAGGRPPDGGYEPPDGGYGYQQYPQDYPLPQMWYGYERAALAAQLGLDAAAQEAYPALASAPAAQTPVPSVGDSDRSGGFDTAREEDEEMIIEPDTTVTLERIIREKTPARWRTNETVERADSTHAGPPPARAAPVEEPSRAEPHEPAQGGYGYQLYPQGYESAQLWYGYERAVVPGYNSRETAPPGLSEQTGPSLADPDKAAFESADESDPSRTLADMLATQESAMPGATGVSSGKGPSAAASDETISGSTAGQLQSGNYTQGLRFDSTRDWPPTPPTPGSYQQFATLSQEDVVGSGGRGGGNQDAVYEPVQREYGYEMYPQGYEPAQLWYGFERAVLPRPRSQQEVSQPASYVAPASAAEVSGTDGQDGGYEPAQLWYGHERAILPQYQSQQQAAEPALQPHPKGGSQSDGGGSQGTLGSSQETLESQGTADSQQTFVEGGNHGTEEADPGNAETGGSDEKKSSPSPADTMEVSYEPAQLWYGFERAVLPKLRETATSTPSQADTTVESTAMEGSYEPAQLWYGFERAVLPKLRETAPSALSPTDTTVESNAIEDGYEPAQLWYGFERAVLPKLPEATPSAGPSGGATPTPASTTPTSEQPTFEAFGELEDYEGISPDTTKTLAQIFQAGIPYATTEGAESGGPAPAAVAAEASAGGSQTSLASMPTPRGSVSVEYVPATGMYGYEPMTSPQSPPSRGSVEHIPADDNSYTQGLCSFDCPHQWPESPPTPVGDEASRRTEPEQLVAAVTKAMDEYAATPATPSSQESVSMRGADTAASYTSGLRWDFKGSWPPTPQTPASRESLRPSSVGAVASSATRRPSDHQATQLQSEEAPRQASPSDEGYEPAQGIYGFERLQTPSMESPDFSLPATLEGIPSDENLEGPTPDVSSSLERIFEDGSPQSQGSQRAMTPSPNLPAFLEKLTSSSESEDSGRRPKKRPSDSAPAVRVPGNRFYSMEEMCTTAPSVANLANLSMSRTSVRSSSDKECYLPWTQRAVSPYSNPPVDNCADYQEPPLVDMDDTTVTSPSSMRSRLTDFSKGSRTGGGYFGGPEGGSSVGTPSSGDIEPPTEGGSPHTGPSLQKIFDDGTPHAKTQAETLANESSAVESAHNDIEEMLARLRALESRLHSVEDESQSKDRQIQELLGRLEGLLAGGSADTEAELNQRLQKASMSVAKLEDREQKLQTELDAARQEIEAHASKLESFQIRNDEIELLLTESQRLQAAGDQQVQQLAQQCGQLAAERDQLSRQLDESAAGVAEKEQRISQLIKQLEEYKMRVEELEDEMGGDTAAAESETLKENVALRERIEELEAGEGGGLKEQLQDAEDRARAMERALDQMTSERRTEEARRREVETQLMQMVRRSSKSAAVVSEAPSATESSADELLDPQLCRRLQQLLDKLHSQGVQGLSLMELKFVKTYASTSQLTPRQQSEAVVDAADMDYATLQRAITRLSAELLAKEDQINGRVSELSTSMKEELTLAQELQRELAEEHDTKLSLTERLTEERAAAEQLETELLELAQATAQPGRRDQTRSVMDAQLQLFAAAMNSTQELVDREQKVMQELFRTADTGCKNLERVQASLFKLLDAGGQFTTLLAERKGSSAVSRLAEELQSEQQRYRDILACLECECSRTAQIYQELDQAREKAPTTEALAARVAELETKKNSVTEEVAGVTGQVQALESASPEDQHQLDVHVHHLQQDVRNMQAATNKVADDNAKPSADHAGKTSKLHHSADDKLSAVTSVVDASAEAEKIRTRIIHLAIELSGRDPTEAPSSGPSSPLAAPEPTPASPPPLSPPPAEPSAPERVPEPEPAVSGGDSEEACSRLQQQLEAERHKWTEERSLLKSHIDRLDDELERLRVSRATKKPQPVPQGQGDDGRAQQAQARYLRAESYRRALCWQKRYLMILLGGYQDTESLTLEKMVQLTGGCFMPNYQRMLRPIRKFRAAAWAVVAMLRMQYMVERWQSGARRPERVDKKERRKPSKPPCKQPGPSVSKGPSKYHAKCVAPDYIVSGYRVSGCLRGRSPPKKPKPVRIPLGPPPCPPRRRKKTLSKSPSLSPPRSGSSQRSQGSRDSRGSGGSRDSRHSPLPVDEATGDPVDDEVTPRADTSVSDDDGPDDMLERAETGRTVSFHDEPDDVFDAADTGRSGPTVSFHDEPDEILAPYNLLSELTLTSEESLTTKMLTEYGNQLTPYLDTTDLEMECGTGSMPNLMALDTRSVCTTSDVESDELELYLAQFDTLLMMASPPDTSTAESHSGRELPF